jgi:hypothetical protein
MKPLMISPRQLPLICRGVLFGLCCITAAKAFEEPPEAVLSRLGVEDFKERMSAQGALVEWARAQPLEAKDWLFSRSVNDPSPEVRRRFTAVLRELVIDDFKKDGEGYAGIMMMALQIQMPGDPGVRMGLNVSLVIPDSAAAKAGLVVGDVITEAGDQMWHDATAVELFTQWVRGHKPGQKIMLKVLRNGNFIPLELVLGRRPPGTGIFMPGELPDKAALERDAEVAKDAYFRNWFENRKAEK